MHPKINENIELRNKLYIEKEKSKQAKYNLIKTKC